MRKLSPILFGLFVAFNAHAAHRTYVAASGADSGTCGPTAPCRTLDYAMGQTDSGGEVIITESGGYGSTPSGGVTITKSISIIAQPGIYAALAPIAGYNGVTIATAGIDVSLKGLTINGRGGSYGIYMTDGASLNVQNCAVSDFDAVQKNAAIAIISLASSPIKVVIANTITKNSSVGVLLDGNAKADIVGLQATNNSGVGMLMAGTGGSGGNSITTAVIKDSVFSQNFYEGLTVVGQNQTDGYSNGSCATCTRSAVISNSDLSNNNYGVFVIATGAYAAVSSSTIAGNANYGIRQSSSAIAVSGANNLVVKNGTDISGTVTTTGVLK